MKIDKLTHELNKLFNYVIETLYNVFNFFFNNDILQQIVEHINEYAKKHCSNKDKFEIKK